MYITNNSGPKIEPGLVYIQNMQSRPNLMHNKTYKVQIVRIIRQSKPTVSRNWGIELNKGLDITG